MGLDVTVLGAGSWGTALAIQLCRNGHDVVLWDHNPEHCAAINEERRNPRYISSVPFPEGLRADPDIAASVARADLLVTVVPSHALRSVMKQAAPFLKEGAHICCATKGIEEETLALMPEVIAQEVPEAFHRRITLFTGPTFALELAQGLPSSATVAGVDDAAITLAADAFHGERLRVYHIHDVVGAALGGSVKNVMAIGCGISDGLGMGANARAALITRGLAEISRIGVAMGADPLTLMGLAGMGDLVLTCTGNLSRNRRVGLALGQGRSLDDILEELGEVAEGVVTAHSVHDLGARLGVELPLCEQIYEIVHKGKSPQAAMHDLFNRERKHERDEHR